MSIDSLEIQHLRNIQNTRLHPSPGLNLVTGQNASGKTSLLEAINIALTGRSFRTRRSEEMVSWDGGPATIRGTVDNRVGRSRLAVSVDRGKRDLLADGIERELDEFIGYLDVVDLTGERMKVLHIQSR